LKGFEGIEIWWDSKGNETAQEILAVQTEDDAGRLFDRTKEAMEIRAFCGND
jgi:hypothetical protein